LQSKQFGFLDPCRAAEAALARKAAPICDPPLPPSAASRPASFLTLSVF
jgi:hypothetical protein